MPANAPDRQGPMTSMRVRLVSVAVLVLSCGPRASSTPPPRALCAYRAPGTVAPPTRTLVYPAKGEPGQRVRLQGILLLVEDIRNLSGETCESPALTAGPGSPVFGSRIAVPRNPDHLFYWLYPTCRQLEELAACGGHYVELHGTVQSDRRFDQRIIDITYVRDLGPRPEE